MLNRYLTTGSVILIVLGLLINTISCDSGIEPSPDPGVLRVRLQSSPSDTSIFVDPDTFSVSMVSNFEIKIFQGKVYKDSNFAVLYKGIRSYKQEDLIYNIVERENGKYVRFTIFESHVPPFDYDRIQFGITLEKIKIVGYGEISVQYPEDASPFIDLYQDFYVSENCTTEINVQISPFKSITRYRDSYQFIPDMRVTDVIYR